MATSTNGDGTLASVAFDLMKGHAPALPSLSRALGGALFDEVVVDSQFTPAFALQPWAPGDGRPDTPSTPLHSLLGNYARPRLRVMKQGETIATFAPYGEPNGLWLPNAVGVGAGIAAATAFLLGHKKTAVTLGLVAAGGFALGYLARPKT